MQSLWMLAAAFLFTLMGVCIKFGAEMYSTSEMIFYRGLIGSLFLYFLMRHSGASFKTRLPWQHLSRGVIGVCSLWLNFYALSHLPLATAMTLTGMSPIWIAAILFAGAWWLGSRRIEPGLLLAIGASFIGVVLVLRPAFRAELWFAGLVALISGVLSAIAYLSVRNMGRLGEPENRIVFYFSLISIIAGLLGVAAQAGLSGATGPAWHPHTVKSAALLLAIGACATSAQIAMTRAFRLGNTLVTANLQYTGIVFSSIWGIVLWNDMLDWHSWLGMAIIVGSGSAATYYNMRKTPAPAAQTVSA